MLSLNHGTLLPYELAGGIGMVAAILAVPFGLSLLWLMHSYGQMLLRRRTLPPGPFPLPLVGNCLQLARSKPWIQIYQWSKDYNSGLITVWIGRTPTVYCNDAWDASELLDKRSNNFSSRPSYVVFGDLTGQSQTNQVILPYNDHWRTQRKIMVTFLDAARQVCRLTSPVARRRRQSCIAPVQIFPSG